jgi:hypothetical protein
VGVWVLPAGATEFKPGTGTVFVLPGQALPAACTARGVTGPTVAASWMDFLGKPQGNSDESTSGVVAPDGRRVYTDVYADLSGGQAPVSGSTVPGAIPGSCGTPITAATSLPNSAAMARAPGLPAAGGAGLVVATLFGLVARRRRRRGLELE